MERVPLNEHISALLERSRHGRGDSDKHLLVLFAAALASEGKMYLELGVRDGTTTLPLLLAAHLNGGTLISVDLQDTTFACPPELAGNWRFVRSDALAFLRTWDRAQCFDFVLIDDWHTYPHVKNELEYLDAATTPATVIFLHDLMYAGTEPRYHTNRSTDDGEWAHGGPFRAVDELPSGAWEWATLPWNNGLTLLRKKGGVTVTGDTRLKVLLAASRQRAYRISRRIKSWCGLESRGR
jgi:predicted O-methyltransferase YrrM